MYFSQEILRPYLNERLITEQRHPLDENLRIFNYTHAVQYDKSLWDDVTMHCRGLVLDVKRERVVAKPFAKFFNVSEHIAQGKNIPGELPIVTEKYDGCFRYDTRLQCWDGSTIQIGDVVREKRVGRSVIVGMAMQFGLYPPPQLGFVMVDIDGTMADIRHRLHYVQQEPKDWDGFFGAMVNDTLRQDVAAQVRDMWEDGYEVVFVSGRPDTHRGITEAWLQHVGFPYYTALFMRRGGDHRPDTTVKEQMLFTYFPDKSLIFKVIDDRKSVVAMWRSHGLDVIDVGDGTDF